jgi:hypothetical protein
LLVWNYKLAIHLKTLRIQQFSHGWTGEIGAASLKRGVAYGNDGCRGHTF